MKTIIEMAREAGFMVGEFSGPWAGDTPVGEQLERFAALVRADENDACASIADSMDSLQDGEIGKAIRARGNT
jgi:hypothetical protein